MTRISGLLRDKRCSNHAEREAVARCPRCGRDFCRECVTEHHARMLCANCLKESLGPAGRRGGPLRFALKALLLLLGIFAAYCFFLGAASLLARIPDKFHDDVAAPARKGAPSSADIPDAGS